MDTEYKPASHKYREEQSNEKEKRVETLVDTNVKKKKKSEISKFADVFISEDIKNVKSYIVMDILVPAIKNAIIDVVTDGVNMIFKGESKTSKGRSSTNTYVSYRDYASGRRTPDRSIDRDRSRFDYDELIFDTRADAEKVLDGMDGALDRYNNVTVADLYDMCNLTAPYTSGRYGWTNLRDAEIIRVRDGYKIRLPRPIALER